MLCPFCCARVADLAAHYAGDNCPALVAAFGPITDAGRRAERARARRNRLAAGNHWRLPEYERLALANDAAWYKSRMSALAYERKLRAGALM